MTWIAEETSLGLTFQIDSLPGFLLLDLQAELSISDKTTPTSNS